MPRPVSPLPLLGTQAGFRRFTVPEYHKMIEIGMLTENDNLELLEGYLVYKLPRNPPHDRVIQRANRLSMRLLPTGWDLRIQSAVTLLDSEPEPDIAIVRGDDSNYEHRHPNPADIGLVIEVSDSTLAGDRGDKSRIYARAQIVCYWIINLVDRQVEVYTQPSGPVVAPAFGKQTTFHTGNGVPFLLDGTLVATIPVQDLLP
ncbi:MAG: Uma2 family endonuclease [Planctomycetes bacterium]|nr:Uma2 family endonuclease [Planctomycetota bacterium]